MLNRPPVPPKDNVGADLHAVQVEPGRTLPKVRTKNRPKTAMADPVRPASIFDPGLVQAVAAFAPGTHNLADLPDVPVYNRRTNKFRLYGKRAVSMPVFSQSHSDLGTVSSSDESAATHAPTIRSAPTATTSVASKSSPAKGTLGAGARIRSCAVPQTSAFGTSAKYDFTSPDHYSRFTTSLHSAYSITDSFPDNAPEVPERAFAAPVTETQTSSRISIALSNILSVTLDSIFDNYLARTPRGESVSCTSSVSSEAPSNILGALDYFDNFTIHRGKSISTHDSLFDICSIAPPVPPKNTRRVVSEMPKSSEKKVRFSEFKYCLDLGSDYDQSRFWIPKAQRLATPPRIKNLPPVPPSVQKTRHVSFNVLETPAKVSVPNPRPATFPKYISTRSTACSSTRISSAPEVSPGVPAPAISPAPEISPTVAGAPISSHKVHLPSSGLGPTYTPRAGLRFVSGPPV